MSQRANVLGSKRNSHAVHGAERVVVNYTAATLLTANHSSTSISFAELARALQNRRFYGRALC